METSFFLIYLIQISALALFLILEKKNLKKPFFKVSFFYALYDILMHASLYVILLMPFSASKNEFIFGLAAAFLIDADHVAKAKSFEIKKLVSIGRRPYTHSLAFAALFSGVLFVLSKNILLSYLVFSGFLIHLLKDITDGKTCVFYPLKRFCKISFGDYAFTCFAILLFNALLERSLR